MKNSILALFIIGMLLLSCSKESNSPDLKNEGDTIKLLADEIPVDSLGNFQFEKVPTTDIYLREDSTMALYFHLMRNEPGGLAKCRFLSLDYLYLDANGDTIFNPYHMHFLSNAGQTRISTLDLGYNFKNYTVDFTGDSVYDGNMDYLDSYRSYDVKKNMLHIYQNDDEKTTVSFKIICIQKDEKYLKAIVFGDKKNYFVKINILRFLMENDHCVYENGAAKTLGDGYNSVTYRNSISRIKRLRKEKVILEPHLTSKDITGMVLKKVRF